MAKSNINGRDVEFVGTMWVYADDGEAVEPAENTGPVTDDTTSVESLLGMMIRGETILGLEVTENMHEAYAMYKQHLRDKNRSKFYTGGHCVQPTEKQQERKPK